MRETDAADEFAKKLTIALALAGVFFIAAMLANHSALGAMFFLGALAVQAAIWLAEIASARASVRIIVWAIAVGWWLVILTAYLLDVAPHIGSYNQVGDMRMYLGVALAFAGFPTSIALPMLCMAIFRLFFASDLDRLIFDAGGARLVVISDCLILFVAAALQWTALALYRRRRRPSKCHAVRAT